ncbi:glycosyltransferase family 4 protein [Deinococcus yavapaiensis]|nr:glycosyltransferase family 4 protein [Deinococcus yavapaiensis]
MDPLHEKKSCEMRILHVLGVAGLPRDPDREPTSGVARAALEIARAQAAEGHEVELLSVGQTSWQAVWQGVKLIRLRHAPWAHIRLLGRSLDFSRHLPLVLYTRRKHFDVVHTHLQPYLRFIRTPLRVAHIHNDLLDAPAAQLEGRIADVQRIEQDADLIVTVSHYLKGSIGRHASSESVKTVHNGGSYSRDIVEKARGNRDDARRSLKVTDENFVILYVGGFSANKGVLHLVNAFEQLALESDRVILALAGGAKLWGQGERPRESDDQYQDMVEQHLRPFSHQVRELGLVAPKDLPSVYAAADVLVVPSVCQEGFGLVAAEGMSMGLPVIASRVGGLSEVVSDRGGLLVPPADEHALLEALRTLLGDASLRGSLAAGARSQATNYTWDRTAQQLLRLYASKVGQ